MDPQSAAWHRAIDARRREILGRLAGVHDRLADVRAARGDWTDEEHDPEGFALTFEWQQAEGVRAQHADELRQLDEADARVEGGTYGTCEVCGNAIPASQLELRPARTRCVGCS
jgi:RNA polymerase-binding transcription factor DksA